LSREFKGKKIIVWPSYIDSSCSRGKGRKIPLSEAVKRPKVDEIVKAAKMLGLEPLILEKKYPRLWFKDTKCIVVNKVKSKLHTLIMISRKIKELRETTSKS